MDSEYHMMLPMPALTIIMACVPSRMVYFICVFLLLTVIVKLLIFQNDFVDSSISILPKYDCTCSVVILYVIYAQKICNAIQQFCQMSNRGTVLTINFYTIFYHASNVIYPECAYKIIILPYMIYVTWWRYSKVSWRGRK